MSKKTRKKAITLALALALCAALLVGMTSTSFAADWTITAPPALGGFSAAFFVMDQYGSYEAVNTVAEGATVYPAVVYKPSAGAAALDSSDYGFTLSGTSPVFSQGFSMSGSEINSTAGSGGPSIYVAWGGTSFTMPASDLGGSGDITFTSPQFPVSP